MAKHTTNPLLVLERCMCDAEQEARAALVRGDMETHMQEGRNFHVFADTIAQVTGVDPRPKE